MSLRFPLIAVAALASAAALSSPAHALANLGAYGAKVDLFPKLQEIHTGGTGQIQAANSYLSAGPGGTVSVSASGSLADGALHSYSYGYTATACTPDVYTDCFGTAAIGGARVAMWDTVSFSNIDGSPRELISIIPLSIVADGHLSGERKFAKMRTYFGFNTNLDPDTLPWIDLTNGTTELLDTLFVPLDSSALFVYVELFTSAGSFGTLADFGLADFGNTLHLSWELPDDLTYTSASGQFLTDTGGVPEPATWALMIAGFGLAGASLRARRRQVA